MRLRQALRLVLAAAPIAGCVSPFTDVWQSPEWSGPPFRNVLVVGQARTEVGRRAYEDAVCARLAKIGVRAEPSYRLIHGEALDREAVARAVATGGQDGLITARLVGVEQRERYVSTPVSGGYAGWRTWGGFYSTTSVRIDQVARFETQAWSLAGEGTMVWAGSSQKVNPRDVERVAGSLADATVGTLQKAGVLPGE
jgi:hypothetical protein